MGPGFFSTSSYEFKVVNWISAICASVVVISVILLKRLRAPAVDRFTFNLQAAIALVDIPRHIKLIYTHNDNEYVCSFLAFLTFFCVHLNLFFNVAIAANLQRLYIQDTIPGSLWRKALYIFPVFFSLIAGLIPMVKLQSTYPYTIEEDGDLEAPLLHNQTAENRQLALRICFLCYSGSMARNIHDFFFESKSHILSVWSFIGLSSTGILNLVAFLFDPALKTVFMRPLEEEIARPSSPYTQRQRNFRNRHRAPTPPRPLVPEQQPVEYGPHLESPHAKYVRERTEQEEKIQFGPSYRVW